MTTKTLHSDRVTYHSKLLKIIAFVENITYSSGASGNLSLDILVNGSSILASGESILLNDTTTESFMNKTYMLYPKDELQITVTFPDGVEWDNLKAKLIASQIVHD